MQGFQPRIDCGDTVICFPCYMQHPFLQYFCVIIAHQHQITTFLQIRLADGILVAVLEQGHLLLSTFPPMNSAEY